MTNNAPLPSFTWPKTRWSEKTPIGGPAELLQFLGREVAHWDWHNSAANSASSTTKGKVTVLTKVLGEAETVVARVAENWSVEVIEEVEALIKRGVETELPLSTSRMGLLCRELALVDASAASWVLTFVCAPENVSAELAGRSSSPGRAYASSSAALATLLASELVTPTEEVGADARQKELDGLREAVLSLQAQADAAIERLNEQEERARAADEGATELTGRVRASHAKQLRTARTKLDELEQWYDKKLALLKPVQYWEQKAKRHRNAWWAYGVTVAALFVGLFVAACFVVDYLNLLPPEVVDTAANERGANSGSQASVEQDGVGERLSKVALLALAIGILVWPLRLLIRLFQREGQLRDDARHRVTLTMTYLALLREDEGHDSAEQRMLVLSNLFAPMGAESSDDAMPNSQIALLTTLLAGRKSSG